MILCACGKVAEDKPGSYECFRCRVASVGFTWKGGGHDGGRANFSARTNSEYIREHVGEVDKHGRVKGKPNALPAERGVWS